MLGPRGCGSATAEHRSASKRLDFREVNIRGSRAGVVAGALVTEVSVLSPDVKPAEPWAEVWSFRPAEEPKRKTISHRRRFRPPIAPSPVRLSTGMGRRSRGTASVRCSGFAECPRARSQRKDMRGLGGQYVSITGPMRRLRAPFPRRGSHRSGCGCLRGRSSGPAQHAASCRSRALAATDRRRAR